MNTKNETTPEVKPAVTEADVVAFMVAEAKRIRLELAPLVGAAHLRGIDISLVGYGHSVLAQVSSHDVHFNNVNESADTIAEAVAKFTAKVRASIPDAAQLRAQAAELTARAEAIEAGAKKLETTTA